MIEDNFLSALAKIMREQVKESNMMNNLYHIIDEELYSCLAKVEFSSVPELSERLDLMLQYINALSLYPALVDKEVVSIYGYYTNQLFDDIKSEIKGRAYNFVRQYNTQIPILVISGNKVDIEVITPSYSKISLDKEEFELLLSQSKTRHIALNKLVKFFVIKLPMNREDKCFILDNTYMQLSEIYQELITTKIYKVSSQDVEYLKPWVFNSIDFIICDKQCEKLITDNNLLKQSNAEIICSIAKDNVYKDKKAIISFLDIFMYSVCPLKDYYNKNINRFADILGVLTNDLVREDSDVLLNFYEDLKGKLETYQQAKEEVELILLRLENEIKNIDSHYDRVFPKAERIFTKCLKNLIFSYYFSVAGTDPKEEEKCLKRILDYGFEQHDLLLAYSKSINGKKEKCPSYNISSVRSWECAKMLVHFHDSIEIDSDITYLMKLIDEDNFTTGKEWYYWSQINNDDNALKTAIQMDSEMAKRKLYEEEGDDANVKTLLSSVLYPDACVERGIDEAFGSGDVTNIHDKRLAYLKIAAAIGDRRGIEAIADILYKNVIWDYFSHKGTPIKNAQGNGYDEVYLTVLSLCELLISQKIEVAKNKERVAIINFCLNRNISEVHATLYNKGSDAAYFCKGYLLEYGLYNTKDLDKALRCYDKVNGSEIPAVSNAKKRVKSKIQTREKNKREEYDEDEDYSEYSSSSIESSSWCFITTAASCALNKERDCDELNFLRRFRDEHIKSSGEGQALVKEYYNIAPKLIEKIDLEEDAKSIYADLWTEYIVPSVTKIKAGDWQSAQDIYIAMVVDLSKKYGVEINTDGYEKLYYETLKRIGYEQ